MAKNSLKNKDRGITPDAVFQLTDRIVLSEDPEGIVTVMEKQDHKIQTFLRRLKFRIPKYKKTELDEYGSFVLRTIDGQTTVEELGTKLKEHFGDNVEPLYDRLATYLHYLEHLVVIRRVGE